MEKKNNRTVEKIPKSNILNDLEQLIEHTQQKIILSSVYSKDNSLIKTYNAASISSLESNGMFTYLCMFYKLF
jgi:LysM repeat protein